MNAVSRSYELPRSNPSAKSALGRWAYIICTPTRHWETTLFLQPGLSGLPDPVPASLLPANDNNNAYAAFGQVVYELTNRLELTGALRYDIDDRDADRSQSADPASPIRYSRKDLSFAPAQIVARL